MKAIVYSEYGNADSLRLIEKKKPKPGNKEILLKTEAVSLNALDWRVLHGDPFLFCLSAGLFKPNYLGPGADVAGVVEELGDQVKEFKVGDRVFGDILKSKMGGCAEYVCAPSDSFGKTHEALSSKEVCTIPIAGVTAIQAIRDQAKISPGSQVLINGATGSVGSFITQLCNYYGADVNAVCSAKNHELAKSLGAKTVDNYSNAGLEKIEGNFDLIIDNVENLDASFFRRLLKNEGTALIVGFKSFGHMLRTNLKSMLPSFENAN